jgi:hypothetical protein
MSNLSTDLVRLKTKIMLGGLNERNLPLLAEIKIFCTQSRTGVLEAKYWQKS